jgi:hypothetical protein
MQSKPAFDQTFRRQLEASAAQGNGPQSVEALKAAVAPAKAPSKARAKSGPKSAKGAAQKKTKAAAKPQPPLSEVLQAILEQTRQ